MARLPQIQPTSALTKAPASAVTGAEIANPYRDVAEALGTLAQASQAGANERAARMGPGGVYRDADGTLKVELQRDSSQSGRAYNRAALQAYSARMAGDIRNEASRLAAVSNGDAAAFEKEWKGFSRGLLKNVLPQVRGSIEGLLDSEGGNVFAGIAEKRRQADLKGFENDLNAEIALLDDEMAALARGGGTGTPEYRQRQEHMASLLNELVDNPEFGMTKRQAEIRLSRMQARHIGESVVGDVEKALGGAGLPAALDKVQRLLSDEKLGLTPAERRQFHGQAMQRLNGWKAERKVALKPVQDRAKEVRAALNQKLMLDDPEVDRLVSELARGGDAAGAMDLIRERATGRFLDAFDNASDPDQAAALERVTGTGSATSRDQALLDTIAGPESGGRYDVIYGGERMAGYADHPRKAVTITSGPNKGRKTTAAGRYQMLASTWDEAKAALDLPDFSPQSQDRAALWLAQRAYRQQTGRELSGEDLADPAVAAQVGAALASTWTSLPGGIEQQMDAQAFVAALKDNLAGGTGWLDPKIVPQMRAEITRDAKDAWNDMKQGIANGFQPTGEAAAMFARQFALIDDEDFRDEVARFFTAQAAAQSVGGASPQALDAVLSALKRDAANGASIGQQEIIAAIESSRKAREKALDEDPLGYGVNTGMIGELPPLDPAAPPAQLAANLTARSDAVLSLQEQTGRAGMSVFRPSDADAVSQFFNTAGPDDQARFLGAMAESLDPQIYETMVGELAGKEGVRQVAAAGALMRDNSLVAQSVLRGRMLLKENARIAPKRDSAFEVQAMEMLPVDAFAPAMEGARQTVLDAAVARYADVAHSAGDLSGDLKPARLRDAIEDVTGGLLEMNGAMVLPPHYGMSQRAFDTLMTRLTDADLAGAVDGHGVAIRAEDLRRHGRLRAVEDGVYMLEFGPRSAPGYAMSASRGGGAYLLDLRRR